MSAARERPGVARARPVVLLVVHDRDDETTLPAWLRREGFEVVRTADDASALKALVDARPDALIAEWRAPGIDGPALAARALERDPAICALLVARDAPPEAAAAALRAGAHDVLAQPVHRATLLAALERGLAHRRLARRAEHLQARLDERFALASLVTRSSAMRRAAEQARRVAATRAPVLLEGEPGSGRRMLAEVIHRLGPRREGPLVSANCGALPAALLDDELFGRERGADGAGPGLVEQADGGTLLLLDVERAGMDSQVKLLRLLHDGAFERAGGRETLRADVRLVAVTAVDLAREAAAGRFREDLHQRLAAVRIALPALRERAEDLPALVEVFVREANRAHRRRVTGASRGALERLAAHAWPGNARELKEAVDRMVAAARGRRALTLSDLPEALRGEASGTGVDAAVGMTMDEVERHLLLATLAHVGGDKVRAARMLGIGLRTLYRRLERYERR